MVILSVATGMVVVASVVALSLHSWAVLFVLLALLLGGGALVVWGTWRVEEGRRGGSYPKPHAGTS
jgi:hypothetical protein